MGVWEEEEACDQDKWRRYRQQGGGMQSTVKLTIRINSQVRLSWFVVQIQCLVHTLRADAMPIVAPLVQFVMCVAGGEGGVVQTSLRLVHEVIRCATVRVVDTCTQLMCLFPL